MKNACNRRFGILVILFVLFIAPGLTAVFLYSHPDILGASTTNKGRLVRSSVKMLPLSDKPKWRLIYWAAGDCRTGCLQQIDKLARIRLALGRRFFDVDEWLILDGSSTQMPSSLLDVLSKQQINYKVLPEDAKNLRQLMMKKPGIFIVSPEGYFVLSYAMDASSDDIYSDLKHLLGTSDRGGRSSHVS